MDMASELKVGESIRIALMGVCGNAEQDGGERQIPEMLSKGTKACKRVKCSVESGEQKRSWKGASYERRRGVRQR